MHQSVVNEEFPPAPIRISPKPWEGLTSFIMRAAGELGYPFPQWLLAPQISRHTIYARSVIGLHETEDYRLLERLLRIDEKSIYRQTIHHFAARLQKPGEVMLGKGKDIQRPLLKRGVAREFFHATLATKVCSYCLEEEPYGRLYWHLWPVFSCLRHRVFLVDRCPGCNGKIPLLRLSLKACPQCKTLYNSAEPIALPAETAFIEDQRFIMKQLGILKKEVNSGDGFDGPLSTLQPWGYFGLLNAFHHVLEPLFPDSPLLRTSSELSTHHKHCSQSSTYQTPVARAILIRAFHFIFASWPENYFHFLNTLAIKYGAKTGKASIGASFGVFYENWLYEGLEDPAFSFLREQFEAYLEQSYVAGYVSSKLRPYRGKELVPMEERPNLTIQQTADMLGVSFRSVYNLIDQGKIVLLTSAFNKTNKRYHCLVEREKVEELRREWGTLISFEHVARSVLGESHEMLCELVENGVLQAAHGPQQDGYRRKFFQSSVVEAFVSKMLGCSKKDILSEKGDVTLHEASRSLRLSIATVIQEILNGHLKPIDSGEDQPLLQRLKLTRSEIKRYQEACERRLNEEQEMLTLQEARVCLGISSHFIGLLLRHNLLEREKTIVKGKWARLLFHREAIEAFQATYMFSKEATELLGISSDEIKGLAKDDILHPVLREKYQGVMYLLFLRQEVCNLLSNTNSGADSA